MGRHHITRPHFLHFVQHIRLTVPLYVLNYWWRNWRPNLGYAVHRDIHCALRKWFEFADTALFRATQLNLTGRHSKQGLKWHERLRITPCRPVISVVTTTKLSPPSRRLATIEPTLPSQCFTVFFAIFLGTVSENCPSLFHRPVIAN